ncbi:hypothetical protein BH10PLA2_BH10PLA2_07680 [soil metagenome]
MTKKVLVNDEKPTTDNQYLKHPKPRILSIDVSSDIVEAMQTAGYNVSKGTFGTPYTIQRSSQFRAVQLKSVRLPELNEQEILIIDLAGADRSNPPNDHIAQGIEHFCQSCSMGCITPRQLAMSIYREEFEKIFTHAGVCIIIANDRFDVDYVRAKLDGGHIYAPGRELRLSNWGIFAALEAANGNNESGREIHFADGELSSFLKRFASDGSYSCSFEYRDTSVVKWTSLAKNKYGSTVAGLLANTRRTQHLLLLPRLPRFADAIVGLLEGFVALWRPDLFPHLEGAKWVHRQEYELPAVTELIRQIEKVNTEAKTAEEELQSKIAMLQVRNADWYTLLRGTGDDLAQAVMRSLRTLGFQKVIDVDEEEKKQGNHQNLREDIRIHDSIPILVIDVKGINDCPSDEEATQSAKHATMRMREWKHTDVKPLTIVNHQRHLPPLERNPVVYRSEIVGNAEQEELGLMTTWDFFRILRNKEHLGWPEDTVKAIFYRKGIIRPVPSHYQYLGRVAKAWSNKLGVVIEENELQVGDRIALEFSILFEEKDVSSIRVNDTKVQHAKVGDPAGVLWDEAKPKVKEGMRVYRVANRSKEEINIDKISTE